MSTGWTGTKKREILEDVHDTSAHALRTVTTLDGVDVNVTAITDSIKIGDASGNYATITNVGGKKSLDVNVTDITISHTDDSIRLGDGTKFVTSTDDGAKTGLDVNILNQITGAFTQAPSGATLSVFDTDVIASGASATVLTYTATASPVKYVQKIYFSAEQVGAVEIRKNSAILYRIRMSPTQYTYTVDVATGSAFGIKLNGGDVIDIVAENNGTNSGVFDATLQLMEAL